MAIKILVKIGSIDADWAQEIREVKWAINNALDDAAKIIKISSPCNNFEQ